MNRYISIIVTLFIAVALSFCTKDYDVESRDLGTPVQFTSSGITPTRVTIADEWEADDEVGIYMIGSESGTILDENIRYGISGGEGTSFATFTPIATSAINYPTGVVVDFLCYYPYTSSEVAGTTIVANAGVDLLISQVNDKSSGESVNFGFEHVMSKVEIAVTAEEDLIDLGGLDDMIVAISSVCAISKYDMLNDVFTDVDEAPEKSLAFDVVVAEDGCSAVVSVILLPGSYDNAIGFKVGESIYSTTLTTTLESGKCASYTAVLGNDGVVLEVDNIVDWNSGASGDVGSELQFDNWIDVAVKSFAFGDGSEGDPWLISNGYELAKLAADLRSGASDYEGEYILLTDDIDLSGAEWTPIGDENSAFKGTLRGKNYQISGMTIVEKSSEVAGLFGYVSGATIESLGVVDCNVSINYASVGGLIGSAAGGSTVNSCFVSGTVTGGSSNVGGLVGYSEDSYIIESYSSAVISGNNASFYVGGLAGYLSGGYIFHSNNLGSVKGCSYVGGVVGYCDAAKVVVCYNSGEVSVVNFATGAVSIGGVVGEISSGAVFGSYNTGDVDSAATATVVGGVVGSADGDCVVTSCYNSGAYSGAGLFGDDYSDQISCYYVGTAGDQGTAVDNIAGLNKTSVLDQMNNHIELWNLYEEPQVLFYYVAGADDDTPPTFAGGSTDIEGVEDWSTMAASRFASGSGSENDPYIISNGYELAKLACDVNDGQSYEDKYFELSADIDLMEGEWHIIGANSKLFKGNFDGNNRSIYDFKITKSASYVGLFGKVSGATIENLTLSGFDVSGTGSVGGLVGDASSQSTITNCHVDGSVYGSADLVGCLAGHITDSFVISCSSAGTVTGNASGYYYVGGLVGYASDNDDVDDTEVLNCYNRASVNNGTYTGGVLGGATDSDNYSHYRGVTICGCYNFGTITSSSSHTCYAGGVAGRYYDSQMVACYNQGEVNATGYAGGVIGCVHVNATTSRMSNFFGCYNIGAVSGSISSDALFGHSDISGVSVVMNCYYTSGTQTGGFGESCTAVNDKVGYLNNAIAYWNLYSARYFECLYGTDSPAPTLVSGDATLFFDGWMDDPALTFGGGDGTSGNPYIINNGLQLARLAYDVYKGENYSGEHFMLGDSFSLSGAEWTPIGTSATPFAGNFDGNMATISGLTITNSQSYQGLFGKTSGATISDLTLSEANVSGTTCIGVLVGEANSQSKISNCHINGSVYGSADLVGGLAGYIVDSSVVDCSSAGSVSGNAAGYYYVGGLIGYASDNDSTDDTEVVNSYNDASVTNGTYTGGVLGGVTDSDAATHYLGVTIFGCFNRGTITSSSQHVCYAGGVAGRYYDGQMVACFNHGSVNATGYAGGVIGCVHVGATTERMSNFMSCYSSGDVSGSTTSEGLFGHSDVSGVNVVVGCYYVGSAIDSSGKGVSVASVADLNSAVAYLNNGIAFWNYNSDRDYTYIYRSNTDGPTLTEGVAEAYFEEWSSVAAISFAGGSGTSGDPYQIANGYQLSKLSKDVESGISYEGECFKITANIDLEDKLWSPIGRDGYIFKGSVDGDGHTISNMKVVEVANPVTSGDGSVGLFGYVEESVISDLTLDGFTVTGTICIGGMFGRADLSTVTNCHVNGEVIASNTYAGLLVGYNVDTAVAGCSSAGTISGNEYTGGLIGYAYQRSGYDDLVISNCSNSASVTSGKYIGGLMGGSADDSDDYLRGVTIYASYNTGEISTSLSGSTYAGGIVGRFYDGQMIGCYNWGDVNNNSTTGYAGGLMGCVHINETTRTSGFYGCYNKGAVSGTASSEALFGITLSLEAVKYCYYIGSTESSDLGVSASSVSDLNSEILNLSGGIAYWNNISEVLDVNYIYESGTNGPTLTSGTPTPLPEYWIEVAADEYAGGSGTSSSPYQISNGAQLAKMAVDYESGRSSGSSDLYFSLTANIDLSDLKWTPICRDNHLYNVYFDGQDHTITGLSYSSTDSADKYVGLFGRMYNSEVSNVGLVDCNITTLGSYVGAVCGYSYYSNFYNCYISSGSIEGDCYIGGVLGDLYYCNIEHCYNQGASVSGCFEVAGVVGRVEASTSYKVYACYNEGSVGYNDSIVSSDSSSQRSFGGIVGYMEQINIIACYNTGTISAVGETSVGGIYGRSYDTSNSYKVYACYNIGSISGSSYVGPIYGYSLGDEIISNNYYYPPSGDSYTYTSGATYVSSISMLNGYVELMNLVIPSTLDYHIDYEYVAGDEYPILQKR